MLESKENKILNLIKYGPTTLVIILIILISYIFFLNQEAELKNDIQKLRKSLIQKNKQKIKSEVQSLYNYVKYERENSEKALKKNLEEKIYIAHKIMTHIYNKYKNTHTKKQIAEKIKEAIRDFRFNDNRGYIYIYESSGVNILHPLKPSLEGENLIEFRDKKGNNIARQILKGLEKSDDFILELYWNKPGDLKNEYKKITYNKNFEPYNWYIGTGEYVDDFEKALQKDIVSYIQEIKHTDNSYIFIIDTNGNFITHKNKKLIGKNGLNRTDRNGFEIIKEVINLAKLKKEGFIRYHSKFIPKGLNSTNKISYVKYLRKWDWIIGTGFYLEELDKSLEEIEKEAKLKREENINTILIVGNLIALIFILLSIYLSKVLKKRFLLHKKELIKEYEKNKQKDIMLSQQTKMAAMGEMIQNITHQWRQPLNAISTYSSGLRFKAELNIIDEKEICEITKSIDTTVRFLSNTIDDFREFFSPHKKAKIFNTKDFVEKINKLYKSQLESKNIHLKENIENLKVCTYENELFQVFVNLINNSKDELQSKDIEHKAIFIDIKKQDEKVFIKVVDTAGGIKEENLQKVFKSGFTTKAKDKGTGIGLYMSQKIIKENLNSELKVKNIDFEYENKIYKGACFTIILTNNDTLN